MNLYGFCLNNPVNLYDYLGMEGSEGGRQGHHLSDAEWASLAGYDSVQGYYAAGWGSYSAQRGGSTTADIMSSYPYGRERRATFGGGGGGVVSGISNLLARIFGFRIEDGGGFPGELEVIAMGAAAWGESLADGWIQEATEKAKREAAIVARTLTSYDPRLQEAYRHGAEVSAMNHMSTGPKYSSRDSARAYINGMIEGRMRDYHHASRYAAIVGNGVMIGTGVAVASTGVGSGFGAVMIGKGTIDLHLNVAGLIDHYQTGGRRNVPTGFFNAVGGAHSEAGANAGAAVDALLSLRAPGKLPGRIGGGVSNFLSIQSGFDATVNTVSAIQEAH